MKMKHDKRMEITEEKIKEAKEESLAEKRAKRLLGLQRYIERKRKKKEAAEELDAIQARV